MKKNPAIKQIDILPLDIALKNPFVTALGHKTMTQNVLVIVNFEGGVKGFGEASSSLAIPSATQAVMMRELVTLKQELEGKTFSEAMSFIERGLSEDIHATSFSALEMALYDVKAKLKGVGLYQLFGGKHAPLETSLTISAWPADLSRTVARSEWKNGFRKFKIKVGVEWSSDLKRVIAVHDAVPGARLIIDGNQGFSVPGLLEFANELKKRNIMVDFVEQPLPKDSAWEEWRLVKEEIGIPVALDESIATLQDAKEYVRRGVVDMINIKLAKSGIGEALRIIKYAREKKIQLMIGCMAESVIGLSASVHLASGTGAFSAIDLDSSYLLKPSKNLCGGFLSKGPILKIRAGVKGSGVTVSPAVKKKEKIYG
ncbi:MAG: dipeptide epimerase [Candidatus Omnitrophica bacterium]|nr:dipeptide epimerase [Candidatus Omnitrophota bacterium]